MLLERCWMRTRNSLMWGFDIFIYMWYNYWACLVIATAGRTCWHVWRISGRRRRWRNPSWARGTGRWSRWHRRSPGSRTSSLAHRPAELFDIEILRSFPPKKNAALIWTSSKTGNMEAQTEWMPFCNLKDRMVGKYQNCHLVLKGSFWFFLVLFLVLLSDTHHYFVTFVNN